MVFDCEGSLHDLCRICLKSFNHCTQDTKTKPRSSFTKSGGMIQYSHNLLIPRLGKLFLDLTALNVNKEFDEFPKCVCTPCRKRLMEYDALRKEALKSTKRLHEMWCKRVEDDHNVIAVTNTGNESKTSIDIEEVFIKLEPVEEDKSQVDDEDHQLLLPELANVPVNIKEEPDYQTGETQVLTPWFDTDLSFFNHQDQPSNLNLEVTFKCGICRNEYVTKSDLQEHTRHHAVPCSLCPKVLSSRSALNRHISVVHRGEKRYRCSFCPKSFGTLVSVTYHERQHTGERPYTCEICSKGFIQQKSLLTHMKRHEPKFRR